jgi:hypothetical protein
MLSRLCDNSSFRCFFEIYLVLVDIWKLYDNVWKMNNNKKTGTTNDWLFLFRLFVYCVYDYLQYICNH